MRKNLILLLLYALFLGNSTAQMNDAGLWTNVSLEKKLVSSFAVNLNQEFRFNENFSELGIFFSDLGIAYKVRKGLSVGANYRFTEKRRLDDSYSTRHRYYFDVSYKQKITLFSFSFRTRFQSQYADFNSSLDGKIPVFYSRNKLGIKYNQGGKYKPYFTSELFYQLSNPDGNEIDNVRFALGIDYELSKISSLELFYLIQQEYNVRNPVRDYVIGMGYAVSF